MTVLRGEPLRLDVVYRPMAWALMVPPAALLSLGLFWWGYLWTAPLPVAGALLAHSAIFWMRGDRPCRLELHPDRAVFEDGRRGQLLTVPVAAVRSATLTLRSREDGGTTAILVLWDDQRPLLSLRAKVPKTAAGGEEVDGDLMSATVGGDGGTAYAFAPVGAVARQLIVDPDGAIVRWYRALPAEVRSRTQIRMWPGEEPVLDLLGRHEEAYDAWMRLDDGVVAFVDGQTETLPSAWSVGHATRQAVLLQAADDLDGPRSHTLDLAVVRIGDRNLAFPAALAADLGEAVALDADTLHTHSGEGAAVLYHLLRTTPRGQWPSDLAAALTDARGYLGGPPGAVA